MNHDAFHSVAAPQALEDSFLLLNGVQDLPPHRRVLAVVLLFRLLQKELGLEVSQLLDMADRIAFDADSRYFHHARAIRDYLRNELS